MRYQEAGQVLFSISVTLVSFYVHTAQGFSGSPNEWSGAEGYVCNVGYGKEADYSDYKCKRYYSCKDYWGTLHYCPEGHQFHFDAKECLKDDQVLCKWQLDDHRSQSGPAGYSSSDYERPCNIESGIEPNYYDDSCKSYYNCKDHGGKLFYCPSGYQFDFEHLACGKDEDVLCKWQLEYYGKSDGTSSGSGSSSRSSVSQRSDSRTSRRSESSPFVSSSGVSEGHICKIAFGYEPNFDDSENCASYWSCEDYWGTLNSCHGSDQFHFQYKMCMNDDDVSCWVQMEKYYHGHSYASSEQSSDTSATTKTCEKTKGLEPNYFDEGCKSYWYCEDHQGTLYECPEGFQFDWGKLDCGRDEEVICEKQMEFHYEHIYYKQVHDEDDPFTTETGHRSDEGSDADYDFHSGSLSNNNQHRCDVDIGRQPDFTSKDCSAYWLCSGYHGTREKCPRGYQFHWKERECLKGVYVDCQKQRDSFPHFS